MSKVLDLPPTPPAWRRWVPLWLRKLIWLDLVDSYDAFLSYSWAADGQIAEVMQGILQRFLCPWYKVRAKVVFRDLSCLPMGTSLEGALRERLNRSTHLIVLACPEAAESDGMEFEAREWLAQKRLGEVLVVVTKGEYRSWSEIRDQALPPALRDNLVKAPIWASLDHLRELLLQRQLRSKTRRASVEALQQLFLTLYPGRTWGDLLGEERVQRNKALKILSATLLVLLSVTGFAGWELVQARQQRLVAVSREIASNAESMLPEDQSQAMNLAMASWQAWKTPQARLAVARSFSSLRATLSGRVAAFSPDSRLIVTGEKNGTVLIWKSGSDQPVELKGHTAEIEEVAFSPDGKWIITASDDRTARLWNAANGKLAATLSGHTGEVYSAAFSPDGHWMATGGADGHVFLWNVGDPRSPVAKAVHEKYVNHVGFSPDGKLVLTASDDHTARLWATAGLTPVATLSGHTDTIWDAQFSPDGTRVVTAAGDNSARLWDAHGQFMKALRGHTSSVTRAVFTADSKRILTASRDGTARLWTAAGEPLVTLQASDTIDSNNRAVNDASVSHNGEWIVTASRDGSVKVWSAASGQILAVLSGHTAGVTHAEFSPDDNAIVTAGDDAARTWNLTAPMVVLAFGDETRVCTRGALSPDGQQLLIGGCTVGKARILSVTTGSLRLALADNIMEPVWSPNGRQIVAGHRVLDASTGQPLYDLTGHTGSVFDTEFSPDGNFIVTASRDQTARVREARTGKTVAVLPHGDRVNSASFSYDSRWVVTAGRDGTAIVWNVSTGAPLRRFVHDHEPLRCASFAPDGSRIITGGDGRTAVVWSVGTGEALVTLSGHTKRVNHATFSPDNRRILTAGDREARLWDAGTYQELARLDGSKGGGVATVAFSRDSKRILITVPAYVTAVYDATSGDLITSIEGKRHSLQRADLSPDGKLVVTFNGDHTGFVHRLLGLGDIARVLESTH